MLKRVETAGFSILKSASADLRNGLTVITGESGSGKTLLMDAVAFVLGGRPHRSLISTGQAKCQVKLVVELNPDEASAIGMPWQAGDNEILRSFTESGRSSASVNGERVNLAVLADFGSRYCDITGQFENRILFDPGTHLGLLDRFVGAAVSGLLQEYQSTYRQLNETRARLEYQQSSEERRRQEIDFLSYQVKELGAADVQPGEKAKLTAELRLLENAAEIQQLAADVAGLLAGGDEIDGAYDLGARGQTSVARIAELLGDDTEQGSTAADCAERLSIMLEELRGIASEITGITADIQAEPAQITGLGERLDLINELERKYHCTADELEAELRTKAEKLALLQDDTQSVSALKLKAQQLEQAALKAGKQLSRQRKSESAKLAEAARKYLDRLGFNSVEFLVDLQQGEELTANGIDNLELLISLNPGEPARPLAQVASGGESSRLLLALKAALADRAGVKVMLLDEIEAGLGGEAAGNLAAVLKDISRKIQVVAVTHLPVVAAAGDFQLAAVKEVRGGSSVVKFTPVEQDARKQELARMLGKQAGKEELALVSKLLEP